MELRRQTKRVLHSHVTGNPNSKQAALSLAEHGILSEFHTSLAPKAPFIEARFWPQAIGTLLQKRQFPSVVEPYVKSHPSPEVLRLLLRTVLPGFARLFDIRAVNRRFDASVALSIERTREVDAVYAYMDAAEQSFIAARKRGAKTIYELPTPHWRFTRAIVEQEAAREPNWAATLPEMQEDDDDMQRRDRELQLADLVIVPSQFVKDSLLEVPNVEAEIKIVPYGCPSAVNDTPDDSSDEDLLRVLFVGSLNQGKGLSYLASAMTSLKGRAVLTLVGSCTSGVACPSLEHFLSAHRLLNQLPHEEVLREMTRHDVLVLPTLYEGQALVVLEAFAAGLPVITTPHSGIMDLPGATDAAVIVPVCDERALASAIKELAEQPERRRLMRTAARQVAQLHDWSHYRESLWNAVAPLLMIA